MNTLKIFKKYFISNYEKMKLSLSLMLGIVAIILLIFYLVGCLLNLWEYSVIDVIFNPIAGSIIISVPLFSLIILLRFFDYCKTRKLFYEIIKHHRSDIKFSLQKRQKNADSEVRCVLYGHYRNYSFRFTYSLGQPLMISLIMDMRNLNILSLNGLLRKMKLKGRHFNGYGLTLDLKRPFSGTSIDKISEKLDILMEDFRKIKLKMEQTAP